eukprot:CAMPEP_0201545320 /NCGR_PEP_ID=MMETSP0173_2-20130828/1845_1 /ASSEMBLY_ACC=CAM_ASM_000268 /TAXON_ID=218659 /ORGANISM="Vexillifera sp., Strain DIVA3 564/2" /LENGTH=220 /DNA_ID=CAMNT_0047953681 /DNA_START=1 /DNA_END=662 /DNA_ORIENTATION=-
MDQLFGGVSAIGALCFTNPADVVRARLQLQRSQTAYRNSFDCVKTMYKSEGIQSFYKGFSVAMMREASKNSLRLGLYHPIASTLAEYRGCRQSQLPVYLRFLAGASSGVLGAIGCQPFEVLKIRLQAKGSAFSQHHYRGVVDGFIQIYKTEGFQGFYRGVRLSMLRSFIGSGANLCSYTLIRDKLNRSLQIDALKSTNIGVDGLSSVISAAYYLYCNESN